MQRRVGQGGNELLPYLVGHGEGRVALMGGIAAVGVVEHIMAAEEVVYQLLMRYGVVDAQFGLQSAAILHRAPCGGVEGLGQ